MKSYSMLITTILILPACMLSKKKIRKTFVGGETFVVDESRKRILEHTIYDKTCSSKNALSNLGSVKIHLWNGKKNKYEKVTYNLSGINGNPIKSRYVSSLKYSYQQDKKLKECKKLPNQRQYKCGSYEIKKINEGRDLFICKHEYPQNSLENQALAALVSVEKTIQCMSPFVDSIPPVKIKISPHYKNILNFKQKSAIYFYDADNAFWTNRSFTANKERNIMFLPHYSSSIGKGLNQYDHEFVLNPGIGSHETGHHIIYHLTNENLSSYTLHRRIYNKTDITSYYSQGRPQRKIDNRLVYLAFHEGFADGISYLCSLYNDNATLRFGRTADIRDPELDRNPDNSKKTLSTSRLRHFFSIKNTWVDRDQNNNVIADDKDAHTIGSFVMHALLSFWELQNRSEYHKKKLLIQSIHNISLVKPDKNPEIYLAHLIFASFKGSLNYDAKRKTYWVKDKPYCAFFKEYFPVNFISFQNFIDCKN